MLQLQFASFFRFMAAYLSLTHLVTAAKPLWCVYRIACFSFASAKTRSIVSLHSTVEAHMPEDHQKYLQWDGDRFIRWAESIGPATAITVRGILNSHKIQQQGYKSCMGLLKLADKYSVARLENACVRALQFTPQPSYKSIKNILVTGQDKLEIAPAEKKPANNEYGFTRGAEYYGRK